MPHTSACMAGWEGRTHHGKHHESNSNGTHDCRPSSTVLSECHEDKEISVFLLLLLSYVPPCDHFLYIESHNNILDNDLTLMHFHYQYCCQILPIQDKFCSLFYMDQWHLFHMYSHGDATIYDESQSNIRQWS